MATFQFKLEELEQMLENAATRGAQRVIEAWAQNAPDPDRPLGRKEIALLAGISEHMIGQYIRERGLPVGIVGGKYCANRADVLEWRSEQIEASIELAKPGRRQRSRR